MKKLLCVFAAMLMLLGLSVAASAAGTESVVVKPSVADPVPGTQIEVSVAISGADPVLGCDIMFAYDETVFEFLSGSWLYPGGTFENGRAHIQFTDAQDINGTAFMLKLRVKEDAVFCDTTVNCNVTATDETGKPVWYNKVTPAQIKIRSEICEHTFENIPNELYLKAEATCLSPAEYYQSCSKCGAAGESVFTDGLPAQHAFEEIQQEEYLLQEASCTAPATYYLSCRICGEKSQETFTVGDPLAHVLAEVAEEAFLATPGDCKNAPTYYLSCEVCGEMSTVTFPGAEPLPHDFKSVPADEYLATPGDCRNHPTYYVSCSACGEAGEETFEVSRFGDHVLEFDCSTICKVCGETQRRDQEHTPGEELKGDETGHWLPCGVCGEKLETAAHVPGPAATPEVPQTCTECGYVLAVHQSHVCEYADAWVFDESGHWHECVQCGGRADESDHIWEVEDDSKPNEIMKGCTVCDASKKETVEGTEPPASEPPATEPSETLPEYTLPEPTQPVANNGQIDKSIRTLVIVLGILLSVSLIGNGVLAYFVITLWPRKKKVRRPAQPPKEPPVQQ